MKKRRIIGIGAICFIPIGLFALSQKTSPGEYIYKFETLLNILLYTWLTSSFVCKILMVINKRFLPILLLSSVLFVIMIIAVTSFGEAIVDYQRPWFYEMLALVWLIGWPLIDAGDLLQGYSPISTTE